MPGRTQCAAVAHLSWGTQHKPADFPALGSFPGTSGMEGRKAIPPALRPLRGRMAAASWAPGLLGGKPIPTCWGPERCKSTYPREFPRPWL